MTSLLWRLANGLQGLFTVLWSLLWIPLALLVRLATGSPNLSLAMARRIWAPGILWACGARLEVGGLEHLEPGRSYLFAVNHQSQMDIPVVFQGLPVNVRFLVKEELKKVPLLGWYIGAMGMVFIERKDRARALKRMKKMTELLCQGACFVTFPEGSRSRNARIQRFKSGALLPALEAGVPVVPVAVEGGDRVLPAGSIRLRPGVIRMAVGEPISVAGLDPADRRVFARQVEERVRDLYASLQTTAEGTVPESSSSASPSSPLRS
ncbi:MAG: 1-acyl-sn-glycerol-3-phosphate acyltransferase [Acidobacteria bacterium]|nr:1-acyl-sn-glycerol-3-phosphate acyltransferase [Acidobacteriota bacterium]